MFCVGVRLRSWSCWSGIFWVLYDLEIHCSVLCIAVLLAVFHYLDDISLWQATRVCLRWQNILNAELCEDQWKKFIDRRWPLFQPQYSVACWKIVYSKMYVYACFIFTTQKFLLVHLLAAYMLYPKRSSATSEIVHVGGHYAIQGHWFWYSKACESVRLHI